MFLCCYLLVRIAEVPYNGRITSYRDRYMRSKDTIINDINNLLEELANVGATSAKEPAGGSGGKKAPEKVDKYSGCMGGIVYLKDQGFFSTPRNGKEVIAELGKEGWHYSSALISMNLLNLTRQRALTRIQDGKKGWLYVVRK